MTTATRAKKTAKQERSVNLMTLDADHLVLWLTIDGDTQSYGLKPIDSDFGVAFQLFKADRGDGQTEEYDVLLHGRETSCTCPGHAYKGKCKHVDALESLHRAGKLAIHEPEPEDEDEELVEITADPPMKCRPYCPECQTGYDGAFCNCGI